MTSLPARPGCCTGRVIMTGYRAPWPMTVYMETGNAVVE